MPNTKRRFADDDPESGDDDNNYHQPVYRGGGKQLMSGKQLQRMQPPPDDDSDEDDDESDYEEQPQQPMRGSGKHFRPSGGKQLRVADHPEEESEEESEDDEPVRPIARGGGKALWRPQPMEESEDDDSDEEDEPPVAIQQRGGGKSLMGMQHRGGGKQLRPPPAQEEEESDEEEEEEPEPMVVTRAPHGGGKQLRRPAPKSESEEDDDDDFDDDAMDIDESSEEEEVIKKPAPKPRGRPKGSKNKPPPKKTPSRAAKKKVTDDMDESSSSEEERELDMETFDTQALVENEEDQKYLDSLPEFEREAILGERFEKLKAAADMKKALRESKRKEREAQKKEESAKKKPAKKKKASKKADTDGDAELAAKLSSARESTRNRDALGTKAKKDAARAKMREQRKTIVQQKEDEEEEEESDLEFESDEDSDDDYEDATLKPWQKKKAEKKASQLDTYEEPAESSDEEMAEAPGKAPAVEAELEDYIKVTLPRRRLARWCNEPFFNRAVVGCFVRLFIGESEDGKKCYRLCEIVDVEKSKSEYKFPAPSSREKAISTTKALKLRFGKNEKVFPMYLVSDSRPTDEDVKKYVSVQKSSRKGVLGKREASKLRKKQDELVTNYTYTEADIEKNVAERKKTGKTLANLGSEQTRVAIAVQGAQSALEEAQRRLDDAKRAHLEASENDSDDLEKAIEEAEEALADAKSNLDEKKEDEERLLAIVDKRKKKLAKQQNWTKVNERAAKMNQNADFQSYKDQQAKKDAEAMSGSAPRFNPYARRKVKPKILWEVGQKEEKKDDDATTTVDNETRDESAEANKAANGKDDQQMAEAPPPEDTLGSQKAAFMGERHQFSIDEEALTPDTASILGTSRKKQKVSRTRKGLSLAEYQDRKTAGTL